MYFQDQRKTWGWPILESRTDQASSAEGDPAGLILESRPMPILESVEAFLRISVCRRPDRAWYESQS